jgi:hypothetical protein
VLILTCHAVLGPDHRPKVLFELSLFRNRSTLRAHLSPILSFLFIKELSDC